MLTFVSTPFLLFLFPAALLFMLPHPRLTFPQTQPATGRALIRANSREFDTQQKSKCLPLAQELAQLVQDRLDLENGALVKIASSLDHSCIKVGGDLLVLCTHFAFLFSLSLFLSLIRIRTQILLLSFG